VSVLSPCPIHGPSGHEHTERESAGVYFRSVERGEIQLCWDPQLPCCVRHGLDSQRMRPAANDCGIELDDFARSPGSNTGSEPFFPPPVARTMILPHGKAEEPCPAIGTELLPPGFVVYKLN
jgi:hypothetical protein